MRRRGKKEGNDVLYVGPMRGSVPCHLSAQNLDFSGFIPLVKDVYHYMCFEDQYLYKTLPFCIFQHAMTEFLNAYLLHLYKYKGGVYKYENPLYAIGADRLNIPRPIYEYICGVGSNTTPTGVEVDLNIPDIAIMRPPFNGCRSGTFGPINAETHNVYECYISPYITSEYIIRTVLMEGKYEKGGSWSPFPEEWVPEGCVPTKNLLGYKELIWKHREAIDKCRQCHFSDDDSILGLLCHSDYVMHLCSSVLGRIMCIPIVKADFKKRRNSAAFIFKECNENEMKSDTILFNAPATLYSPFPAGASAMNQANYFAYKRKRNRHLPGTCFVNKIDRSPPSDWLETINDNFCCTGAFGIHKLYRDMESLREENHIEPSSFPNISMWLESAFK